MEYPILGNRPINQWKVIELKEELRRRKITTKGLKEDLVKRLSEAVLSERELAAERDLSYGLRVDSVPEDRPDEVQAEPVADYHNEPIEDKNQNVYNDAGMIDNNLDVNQGIKEVQVEPVADNHNEPVEDKSQNVYNDAGMTDNNLDVNQGIKGLFVEERSITYSSGLVKEAIINVVSRESESSGNRSVATELESSVQAWSHSKKNGDSEAPAKNVSVVVSEPSIQVSEVTPDLGFAVKCEPMFTEDSRCSEKNEDSKPPADDVSVSASEISNQASEVIPDLGFAVKCESVSSEDLSYREKNEDSKRPAEDVSISLSEPSHQVSEVSPDFGFAVKCESMSGEDLSYREKNEDSKRPAEDVSISLSEPSNQVSEVRPDLVFEVKCESNFSDSMSINEKHELKDNLNADDCHLEQGVVKPESVQPSSIDSPPVFCGLRPLVEEQGEGEKQGSLLELDSDTNATDVDLTQKNDSAEGGSPEKLNLDRSSGDESMEEDVVESKQIESNNITDGLGGRSDIGKVRVVEIENPADALAVKFSTEKEGAIVGEETRPAAPTEKRKLGDKEGAQVNESKRQRRWNPETIKAPEPQAYNLVSGIPKDTLKPTAKQSFTRSDSQLSEDAPKDRTVPPSKKAPTTSLRIDRFLRPFTLKAVQELLSKTGTVCNFWMDQIKTHCYVTYSSVEEAVATRNAVYNLQWPPNGGRLLVAQFVDPQDVKLRAEAPPPSRPPAIPSPVAPAAPSSQQPQVSQPPRQHDLRQKLPPAHPHPQPANQANPPTFRERFPSPPTLPEKADPPVLTLDDLFKKTRVTPRVYYLPLSEEQVAAKLTTEGKSIR